MTAAKNEMPRSELKFRSCKHAHSTGQLHACSCRQRVISNFTCAGHGRVEVRCMRLQPPTNEMKIWEMPKMRIQRLMPNGVPG